MANGCNLLPDKYLKKGAERLGVLREFQRGKKPQDLTFVVKAPELYAIAKAWPKLDQKLRDVLASLVEMAKDK